MLVPDACDFHAVPSYMASAPPMPTAQMCVASAPWMARKLLYTPGTFCHAAPVHCWMPAWLLANATVLPVLSVVA